jgi:Rrf2 family iron-sulfur cluster assembly transcriptional regulator
VILSQTAVYALKAVLCLAEAEGDAPLRVDDIAGALDVPRNYLSKILHVLAREGVLASTRGPHGGFRLGHAPSDLRLETVIRPFDEITTTSTCLLGRARCSDANPCAAHARWKSVSRSVQAFLNDTTIEDLTASGAGTGSISAG